MTTTTTLRIGSLLSTRKNKTKNFGGVVGGGGRIMFFSSKSRRYYKNEDYYMRKISSRRIVKHEQELFATSNGVGGLLVLAPSFVFFEQHQRQQRRGRRIPTRMYYSSSSTSFNRVNNNKNNKNNNKNGNNTFDRHGCDGGGIRTSTSISGGLCGSFLTKSSSSSSLLLFSQLEQSSSSSFFDNDSNSDNFNDDSNGDKGSRSGVLEEESKSNFDVVDDDDLYDDDGYIYDDDEYNNNDDEDTIFALSSGGSSGGIGSGSNIHHQPTAVAIIRISGPRADEIIHRLSSSSSQSSSSSSSVVKLPKPRYATLRTLYHPTKIDVIIDQVLLLRFPKPYSYTGEDVYEIHCHGSRAVLNTFLLDAIPNCNNVVSDNDNDNNDSLDLHSRGRIRLAERGEFTSRALRNGKLDILQVEALDDLLYSDTDTQRIQALKQLDGRLSTIYQNWRSQLIEGLAHAEAVIDFGDDEMDAMNDHDHDPILLLDHDNDELDYEPSQQSQTRQSHIVWGDTYNKMIQLRKDMEYQLKDERRGELIRDGIRLSIIGPPNAGKSSLFNVLSKSENAIVTNIAGTTRDVLETTLNIAGCKCILQDTAGIRGGNSYNSDSSKNDDDDDDTTTTAAATKNAIDTDIDVVELEGIKRAIRAAKQADIVILVVDGTTTTVATSTTKETTTNDVNIISSLLSKIDGYVHPSNILLVINKSDLNHNYNNYNDQSQHHHHYDSNNNNNNNAHDSNDKRIGGGIYPISCITKDGIDQFMDALSNVVTSRISGSSSLSNGAGGIDEKEKVENNNNNNNNLLAVEGSMITRARHRQHINAAVDALKRYERLCGTNTYNSNSNSMMTVDLAAEELRYAAAEIGRITGVVDIEHVLDQLFHDFCIGK